MTRYRIIDSLGRGGMGEVCLADDLLLHRHVAVKFLSSSGDAGEDDALDRLLSEARASAALDHPFICSIYEVTTLDGRPCIVMEYVRGETLERRLRRGALPLADALHVGEEIAEALDAAHRRRIVHRDLKPANVMVTEDHHVKVMDFGLSTRLPMDSLEPAGAARVRAPDAGVVVGTPSYMAPEQIRGGPADLRSDIFAFGIVLHELLTGGNPFHRATLDATLAAILGEAPGDVRERAAGVPPPLAALVARMLAKEPQARPQSFADIRMALRRLSVDVSVPAAPVGVPPAIESSRAETSARLIGREAERAQLTDCVRQAAAGRGSLVVLEGEAGIGKTYLADEALRAAGHFGCLTLAGRCYEREGTPLVPFIEVLEHAARVLPAASLRAAAAPCAPELAALLPELHRIFPDMDAPLELPPQLRQRFLFRNIEEFLARCGQVAPVVVFIDDLQWADDATLQCVRHLAARIGTRPVLMLAGWRGADDSRAGGRGALQQWFDRVRGGRDDAASTVESVVADLVRQGAARTVALRAFAEADVRSLIAALAGDDPPPRLVKRFVDHTGGNPLFVAELYRHLKEEGRLFDAQGRWRRDVDPGEVAIPESVRGVLERRIQRVSPDTLGVLRAAAVIGHQFDLDLLESVAGVEDAVILRALEEAERARLVKGPSGRQEVWWRFPHQLICQLLAGALPLPRRQRLHLQIADAMARIDPNGRTHRGDVAHHLYSAGRLADAARAARALVEAGDAAYEMYATDDAMRHYRRALEVLGGGADDVIRRRVEERLADLLALVGERVAALQTYDGLAARLDGGGDPIERARIARKTGTVHWQGGDRDRASACYRRALDLVDGSDTHLEAAHVYQELGRAAFRSGDNAQAIHWAERALASADAVLAGDAAEADARRAAQAAVAHATNTIGVALARGGALETARERIERGVAVARDAGLLDVACRGYANLGVLYSAIEPQRAIEVSHTGLELASRIGAASLQSYIYANLAAAYCALTERCEAEGFQAAQTAATLDRELGQLDHLAVPLIVIAQIHQCRGELQQAQEAYREALALAERIGEPQLLLPCYDGLATVYLDRGDRDRAAEYLERARQLCDRAGLDPDTLLLLPFLC